MTAASSIHHPAVATCGHTRFRGTCPLCQTAKIAHWNAQLRDAERIAREQGARQ